MSAFNVIVSYAAGRKMEGNAWHDLCIVANNHNDGEALVDVLKNGEKEFKERTKETRLPTTYRTAKCIILSANDKGVAFMSADGKPIGKSAVEKAIREKSDPAKPIDKAEAALKMLDKALHMCSTGAERNAVEVRIRVAIDSMLKV
jgi:hypothetical protein